MCILSVGKFFCCEVLSGEIGKVRVKVVKLVYIYFTRWIDGQACKIWGTEPK